MRYRVSTFSGPKTGVSNTLKNFNEQKSLQKLPNAPLQVVTPPLKTLGIESSKKIF